MAVGDLSFAFNPQIGETPQTVAAKRALALAIMGNTSHAPRDIGEGLNSIGQAIMFRNLMKGVNTSEASGVTGADKMVQGLFGGGDQSQFPAAPAPSANPSASAPASGPSISSATPSDAAPVQSASNDGAAPSDVEAYIRQSAAARGIDPDVAVKVASGEGGLTNPFRRGEGPAPRSQAPGLGATENSYGPLQLYVSGTGAGLGDRALAAGIDPRKDWKGGVDFALDEASKKGWGQWYGAKAQGITGMHGIGQPPAGAPQVAGLSLPGQAPVPQPNPMQDASAAAPVQVASLDPSAGMTSVPTPSGGPMPPLPSMPSALAGIQPPQAYAPQQQPTDAKQAIMQAMAGQNGAMPPQGGPPSGLAPQMGPQDTGVTPGAPGATSPAGQRVLAAMMQSQPMSGGNAPLPMQGGGMPAGPQPTPQPSPQVAQAAPQGGPDMSKYPVIAGGTSDAVQPGAMQPRTGPTPQQLIQAAGNPWVMQRYGPIIDAMIQQQMTPHKIEMVPLGNGVTAEIDSLTGRQIGQIKGAPSYTPVKDAAGNEYLVNPADPTHPIGPDQFAGGLPGGGAGQPGPPGQGGAPQTGQADPYASPFPRTMPLTDDMKAYNGYLAQSRATNMDPSKLQTFQDYSNTTRKASSQTVNFNQENEAAKKVGAAVGGNMADYIDGTKDARTKLQALNTIKGVLDKYGDQISTGPGAQTMLSLKQGLANVFPGMADAATPTEMLQKMSTQLATADAKSLASRPTQFDFATYLKNNPGIQMSIEGQKALVDLKLQQAQHDYELGSLATHKQYSAHPEDWADVVAQYDKEHPLINPLTNKPADENAVDFPDPTNAPQPKSKADFDALPSGTEFVAPDGSRRRKP